jgi:hypothetical protein
MLLSLASALNDSHSLRDAPPHHNYDADNPLADAPPLAAPTMNMLPRAVLLSLTLLRDFADAA